MARPTGEPTWLEYSANGMAGPIDFYRQIFGWEFEDLGPEMHHYHMAVADGSRQSGFMDTTGMTCPDGEELTPSWDVYLAVDSVEERLEKARAHGARVVVEPARMEGVGTFAGICDPTGAFVGLWEDGGFEGYVFSGKPGTPVWFELMSMDFDASAAFYSAVFDFDITLMDSDEDDPQPDLRYATNAPGEKASAGMCEAKEWFPAGTKSFWRPYFGVADADATVAAIEKAGGKLLDGPIDSPFGRVATVADPTGASFQINQPLPGGPGAGS